MESESTCRAYMTNSTGYRLCGKPALGDGGRCQKHVEADLGCLVNIPDGAGGHRLCDKPVGRDGDILSGACVMENGSGNPARRQMSRAEMRREF